MVRRLLLMLLWALSFSVQAFALDATKIECEHYWLKGEERIASGKVVGTDVGESPFGKMGSYECHAKLTLSDLRNAPFLFIGEVGDCSYFELISTPNVINYTHRIIKHGLDPRDATEAWYSRYIPFVVPLDTIYATEGEYRFRIVYRDLVPMQVGIRSGPLTLENWKGVFKRAFLSAPAFTYHFLQVAFLLLSAVGFCFWPGMPIRRRLLLSASAITGALVIVQITAVPRSFFSPSVALHLTVLLQLVAFPFLLLSLLDFLKPSDCSKMKMWKLLYLAITCLALGVLGYLEPTGSNYFALFGFLLMLLIVVPLIGLSLQLNSGKLRFRGGIDTPRFLPRILLVLGVLYTLDLINLVFLHGRFYYYNHYLLYVGITLLCKRLQYIETLNEGRFRSNLEKVKRSALDAISGPQEFSEDPLKRFISDVGLLIRANRVSIAEMCDERLKFLGLQGAYSSPHGLQPVVPGSVIDRCIKTGQPQVGSLPLREDPEINSDYLVLPLRNHGKVVGVLNVTAFERGQLSAFVSDRISTLQHECEAILNVLLAQRHNQAQGRLLQMIRLRTYPLQLESEEHFLRNFDVSPTLSEHAFIMGDLVDSTILNERFGGGPVEQAMDAHLNLVWSRFKHLGVVLSRTKGDSVSVIVPNQSIDSSAADAVLRCYEVLRFLAGAEEEFHKLTKENGIALKIRYRFAMSKVKTPLLSEDASGSIKASHLIVDASMDAAARAIGSIALAGECLVLQPARELLFSVTDLVVIPPHRVKGKAAPMSVFLISNQKSSAA